MCIDFDKNLYYSFRSLLSDPVVSVHVLAFVDGRLSTYIAFSISQDPQLEMMFTFVPPSGHDGSESKRFAEVPLCDNGATTPVTDQVRSRSVDFSVCRAFCDTCVCVCLKCGLCTEQGRVCSTVHDCTFVERRTASAEANCQRLPRDYFAQAFSDVFARRNSVADSWECRSRC